jgi:hypothetical protein
MAVGLDAMYSLALFASGFTLMMMGTVYALGTLLNNPRFTVWVKTEIFQVFVSIVLVYAVLFFASALGLDHQGGLTVQAGWITTFAPDSLQYEHPEIDEEYSVLNTSQAYLRNLAFFNHKAVRGARTAMGAFDEYSKYTKQPCVPGWLFCMMGHNGVSVRPLGGASAMMQATNLLLYTSTASYLTVLAQLFFLEFIAGGFAAAYLPIAIVLRSLPFMRQFGGGLLAICISLFLIYPALLFVEASFWNPWTLLPNEDSWGEVSSFVSHVEANPDNVSYGNAYFIYGDWFFGDTLSVMNHVISVCSAAFLSATFLFTFNIIAITASARAFGRLMGADVDLSRLVQIV